MDDDFRWPLKGSGASLFKSVDILPTLNPRSLSDAAVDAWEALRSSSSSSKSARSAAETLAAKASDRSDFRLYLAVFGDYLAIDEAAMGTCKRARS
jgi:hypothetical protein